MKFLNVRHQCHVFLALFFTAVASPRCAAQTLAYITNEGSNNVSVIDTATDAVKATIPVGSRPFGVAVNEQGTRAYITNSGSGTVSVIDTHTNTVMATIPVGVRPLGVAVNPDGTRAFVANFGSSSVTVIDSTSNTVMATIPLGLTATFGVGVNRQGTKVYVTGEGGQLFVIDAKNNTLENSFLVPCCPFGVAVDQSSIAYIAGMSPGLVSFDMATDSVLTRTQFLDGRFAVAVDASGSHVYVTDDGNARTDISLVMGGSIVASVPTTSSEGISITPDGKKVYSADVATNSVDVLDTASNTIIKTIPVGAEPIAFGRFIGTLPPPIELVDPVPDLLDGPQITTDGEMLASKGTVVTGIAADGVSEVVVRIVAQQKGEIFNLSVTGNSLSVLSIDEDGGLASADSPSVFQSSLTITAVDTSRGPMAFAFYRAPFDFVRLFPTESTCKGVTGTDALLACRIGTILIQDSTGHSVQFQVTIVRPPVFLIHGIWSDPSTWNFFSPLVTGARTYDSRFKVYRANYSQHSGDSIDSIERGVFEQLIQDMNAFKQDLSVAAVQADLVTHSMGGLVARDMVLDPRFAAAENFQQGVIHKLITIGTPHNGSNLATQLLASSSLCKSAFGFFQKPVSGAVTDLSLGNSFLQFLNSASTPPLLRAHAIVGTASTLQELASQASFDLISWGASRGLICSNLLPPLGGYQELFGGSSDLLVSLDSQHFGFAGALAVDFPAESMVHAVGLPIYPLGPDELNRAISLSGSTIPNSGVPQNPNLVLDLLNTPIKSSVFVAIHP